MSPRRGLATADPWAVVAALRVVPVAVIDDAGQAQRLGETLVAAGLPCIEVTLRTPAALDALRDISGVEGLLAGAGTVIRQQQVEAALDAGARFIVSPGLSLPVLRACAQAGVPYLPGVATATEIQLALDEGIDTVKLFPAELLGGPAMISALAAPFGEVRFVPSGGITAHNAAGYLALPNVLAIGGSWMVAPTLLAAGDFAAVGELAGTVVSAAANMLGATS